MYKRCVGGGGKGLKEGREGRKEHCIGLQPERTFIDPLALAVIVSLCLRKKKSASLIFWV